MNEGRKYRILETLGHGGFGTVYRAELLGAGGFTKHVALKVLKKEGQDSEQIATRFRDEARVLGLINHRAVVQVDGLAQFDRGYAVVMEYVEGVDVSVLRRAMPPVRASLEIVEEVASALHTAYMVPSRTTGEPLKLVHRDIKPANIRITATGDVKLLDFGVARADFAGREAHTEQLVLGTFAWMAPERLEGVSGPAGDVYGLGLVLAQLLTTEKLAPPTKDERKYPRYVEKLRQAITIFIDNSPWPMPSQERLIVLDLVERMIAFEPEDRPTAREVERACRDLKAIATGPWLREWAEEHVSGLVELRRSSLPDDEGMTGSILVERTGGAAQRLPGRTEEEEDSIASPVKAVRGATPTEARHAAPTQPKAGGRLMPLLLFATAIVVLGLALLLGTGGIAALAVVPTGDDPVSAPATVVPVEATPKPEPRKAEPVPSPQPEAKPIVAEPTVAEPIVPEPIVPEPTPVEAPAKAAPAEPKPLTRTNPDPPVGGALVKITGDARKVSLSGGGSSYPAGPVPAGSYTIVAEFEGATEPFRSSRISLEAGQTVTIRCNAMMMMCTALD